MPGWQCKECPATTWRRPPYNLCCKCRPSQRGQHHRKSPRHRIMQKTSNANVPGKYKHNSISEPTPGKTVGADCSNTFRTKLDGLYSEMSALFGRASAHSILACSHRIGDRIGTVICTDLDIACASLICVAISLVGLPDTHELTRAWLMRYSTGKDKATRKRLLTAEASWINALPPATDDMPILFG